VGLACAGSATPAAFEIDFFYTLLAKQRKVSRPPRRQSGSGTHQRTG
jgi:hypothetical protein